jgi:hypothetical protein
MDTAREYAADYFGLNISNTLQDAHSSSSSSSKDSEVANNTGSSSGSSGEGKGQHNDGEFFVLRGFLRAHQVR